MTDNLHISSDLFHPFLFPKVKMKFLPHCFFSPKGKEEILLKNLDNRGKI